MLCNPSFPTDKDADSIMWFRWVSTSWTHTYNLHLFLSTERLMGDAENLHQGKTELCPRSHSWCRVECGCGSMSIPNPQHSVLTLSCTPSQPGFLLGGEWWVHPSPPEHPPSVQEERDPSLPSPYLWKRRVWLCSDSWALFCEAGSQERRSIWLRTRPCSLPLS